MTNVIDYILSVDTFEQQCVVLEGMLQSPSIKDNIKTIDIDQSFSKACVPLLYSLIFQCAS